MKPKKRHTKSRKRVRRGAIKFKSATLTVCPKCKRPIKPHTACSFCGTYKGKKVLDIKLKKKEKKELKKKQKAEAKDKKDKEEKNKKIKK